MKTDRATHWRDAVEFNFSSGGGAGAERGQSGGGAGAERGRSGGGHVFLIYIFCCPVDFS